MSLFRIHQMVIAALVLSLQACAGGGETGTGANNGGGGTDVSVGTITAFGSVWVNGVEFETTSSAVKLEGTDSATSALKLGMVVVIKGTINADGVSGTADQILVEEVLKGPIAAIGTQSFTVLGQQVNVNETTRIEDGLTFGDFVVNNFIEVSGVVKSDGVITATRLERKSSPETAKLKGIVSNINAGTFMIGALTVDYSGISGLPNGVPANGLLVEVKGTPAIGVLYATSLEAETLDVEDADEFEIEGYVGTVSNAGASFTVNNVTVQTSGITEFSAGLITDLVPGVFVEVEGALQGGIVTAGEVKFREGVKLESVVATNNGTDTLTLTGFGGLSVTVDSETEISGDGVTGIGDVVPGTHRVSVRGRYYANKVIATRIEVEASADPDVVLQGPVDLLNNPVVTLMGIAVTTSGSMSFEADGANDQASFFTAVSVGDVVSVEGTLSGATVTWDSIELED